MARSTKTALFPGSWRLRARAEGQMQLPIEETEKAKGWYERTIRWLVSNLTEWPNYGIACCGDPWFFYTVLKYRSMERRCRYQGIK